jgi:hypothetical protein
MIAMRRRASIGLGLPGWGMGAGEYMPKTETRSVNPSRNKELH